MLLIHGWGVSGALFAPQLESLSARFRVVVPDLPGHGGSPAFPAPAPFSMLADRIAALIEDLDLQRICLVGWSLGAMVAWDLVLRYRNLDVRGLVTIDMVPHVLNDDAWPYGLRDGAGPDAFGRDFQAMQADWPAYAALFVPRIFAPGFDGGSQDWLGRTLEVARANDPASLIRIWKRMVEKDFRAALRTLELPCLCTCGTHSQLYSVAACDWVVAQIPGAQLQVFEHSGHAPHIEEPEHFNRILSAFADALEAPTRRLAPGLA